MDSGQNRYRGGVDPWRRRYTCEPRGYAYGIARRNNGKWRKCGICTICGGRQLAGLCRLRRRAA
jgi:hypothetical protein